MLKRSIVLLTALVLIAGASVVAVRAASTPEDAEYVGTSKCKICHMEEYNVWAERETHATAFDDLLPEEREKEDCVKCHVTGYGEESGFKSAKKTPDLKHVGCESCHGPGSAHVKESPKHLGQDGGWDTKIDAVPVGKCVKCHNEHVIQKERAEDMR